MPHQAENKIYGITDQKMCILIGSLDFLLNIFLIWYMFIMHDLGKNSIVLYILIIINILNICVTILMLFGVIKEKINLILPYIIGKYIIISCSIGAILIVAVLIICTHVGMAAIFIPFIILISLVIFVLSIIPVLIVRKYHRKLILKSFDNDHVEDGYNDLPISLH